MQEDTFEEIEAGNDAVEVLDTKEENDKQNVQNSKLVRLNE